MTTPNDILEAARECLSALISAGVVVHPEDQATAQNTIAQCLLHERERLQNDVIAAVADETEECRQRVFLALRRGASQ